METEALDAKARECHISSSGQKRQDCGLGTHRKINRNLEQTGGLDEVGLTRAGIIK